MRAAAVTGLAAEARIARRAGIAALATGGHPPQIAAAVARLAAEGATALISFGICGGLDPVLPSGSIVLPLNVRDDSGACMPVDVAWHARAQAALAAGGVAAAVGDLLGAAEIAATPQRKSALFRASGAVAVDLESHLAARAALRAGLPFLVLRAVADPAGRTLPSAALIALDTAGRPLLGAVLASLARSPGQVPALLRVALETRRALAALGRAAAILT